MCATPWLNLSTRWMIHVTHESCHTWVMSHAPWMNLCTHWMSHVAHMNDSVYTLDESCHTYEWVMLNPLPQGTRWQSLCTNRMSHVTHMNESCHIHANESCRPYEWVMSHTWMGLVAHVDASCPIWQLLRMELKMAGKRDLLRRCCRWLRVAVFCSVLQCGARCVAVWCSVVRCVEVWCSVLQCGAVCCRVLPCVAVSCMVLR